MSLSRPVLLRALYDEALRRLAFALELDYVEVLSMFGDIDNATPRAEKIVGFFQSPEINSALQDVIYVAQEYQDLVRKADPRFPH